MTEIDSLHKPQAAKATPLWIAAVVLLGVGLLQGGGAFAQVVIGPTEGRQEEAEPEADPAEEDESGPVETESGSLDDSAGSIVVSEVGEGWLFKGDMRTGFYSSETDNRDGTDDSESDFRGRFRAGGKYGIRDNLVFAARVASICSTDECDPEFVLDSTISGNSSIANGEITLDELYIHAYRRKNFDLAVGRLQTKFVSAAGVFAKSLDRNDSHNWTVNWTDGVHGTLRVGQKWTGHLILQKNQSDGATNVRRGPIDFTDDDSRITYFVALENRHRLGPIDQQGLDITYMPASLLKDGDLTGRVEDYWGIVGRFAAGWPKVSTGPRLRIAGEVGYAPETPTRVAMGLPGNGNAGGFAWNIAASWVDFRPNHSVGINYGYTEAGWLISPQYRNNDELYEIRYLWRRRADFAFDIRLRLREEIDRLTVAERDRSELDIFARFNFGFGRGG